MIHACWARAVTLARAPTSACSACRTHAAAPAHPRATPDQHRGQPDTPMYVLVQSVCHPITLCSWRAGRAMHPSAEKRAGACERKGSCICLCAWRTRRHVVRKDEGGRGSGHAAQNGSRARVILCRRHRDRRRCHVTHAAATMPRARGRLGRRCERVGRAGIRGHGAGGGRGARGGAWGKGEIAS
jgi:hypothetical protein